MIDLKVENLTTGYDRLKVIDNISFEVKAGEIISIIGHNGAGKSTLFKSIIGILKPWAGVIKVDNQIINYSKIHEKIKNGVCYIPQDNNIFDELSVQDNLYIGCYTIKNKREIFKRIDYIYELLPDLKEKYKRIAGSLSGGEQKLLAFSNALVTKPHLILFDEPSLGLSKENVEFIFTKIQEINNILGTTVLLIEQKLQHILKISKNTIVMKLGSISYHGASLDLNDDDKIKSVFL